MTEKETEENLKRIAKEEGGTVVIDPQFGKVVHVSAFVSIAPDGTKIYEWP